MRLSQSGPLDAQVLHITDHRMELKRLEKARSGLAASQEPPTADADPRTMGDETKAALLRLADLVRRSGERDPKGKKRSHRGRSSGSSSTVVHAYEACRDLLDAPQPSGQTLNKFV